MDLFDILKTTNAIDIAIADYFMLGTLKTTYKSVAPLFKR
jgi:hypothetical protein